MVKKKTQNEAISNEKLLETGVGQKAKDCAAKVIVLIAETKENLTIQNLQKLDKYLWDNANILKKGRGYDTFLDTYRDLHSQFYAVNPGILYIKKLSEIDKRAYTAVVWYNYVINGQETDLAVLEDTIMSIKAFRDDTFLKQATDDILRELAVKQKKDTHSLLGDTIKHQRLKLGMTLADLSEKTGVSTSYINRLERGDRKTPSIKIAKQLAEALNIPLSTIVDIPEKEEESSKLTTLSQVLYSNRFTMRDGEEEVDTMKKEILVRFLEFVYELEWKDKKLEEVDKLISFMDTMFKE